MAYLAGAERRNPVCLCQTGIYFTRYLLSALLDEYQYSVIQVYICLIQSDRCKPE